MRTNSDSRGLLEQVVAQLRASLPSVAKLSVSETELVVLVEQQKLVFMLDVRPTISAAGQARLGLGVDLPTSPDCVLVTRYLPKPLRDKLRELGVNFVDAAGNINIQRTSPMFVVSVEGKSSDPARPAGRPVASLKGLPASQVARVLLDFEAPIEVADVIRLSGASRGSVYRAVDYLQQVGIIERASRGRITFCDWAKLLELWSEEYGVLSSNRVRSFIAARGIDEVVTKLRATQGIDYAMTGTVAAANYEAFAPAFTAIVYTNQIDELAHKLSLRETSDGGNVLLIEPNSDLQLRNTTDFNGLRVAAVSQIAVDLLTGPGRNPEEGKALVRYLKGRNDWRLALRNTSS